MSEREPTKEPTPETTTTTQPTKSPPQVDELPPYKVLLHNDDENDTLYVVETVVELTPLSITAATQRMLEAHNTGIALLLTTHQERAELYQQQFTSKSLTVTIEPAE